MRKEYSVESFKKAIAAVVEKEARDSKPPTTRSRYEELAGQAKAGGPRSDRRPVKPQVA